mgnify:FL=1
MAVEEEITAPTAASSTPIVEEVIVPETEITPVVSEIASSTPDVILKEEIVPAEATSSTPDVIAEETEVSESEPQSSPEATSGEAEITPAVEEAVIPEPEAIVPEPSPVVEETPAKEENSAADVVITETDKI